MCPVCDGDAFVLGCLGDLLWLRCRSCGLDFSQSAGQVDDWRENAPIERAPEDEDEK